MEGRRPEVLLGAELDRLRSGHFRCDNCQNWLEGQVPSQEFKIAIERGIVIYEEYCRTGRENTDCCVSSLHDDNSRY
jgi:hypothetical protein